MSRKQASKPGSVLGHERDAPNDNDYVKLTKKDDAETLTWQLLSLTIGKPHPKDASQSEVITVRQFLDLSVFRYLEEIWNL